MTALPQWEKLDRIINSNGLAIGFDLETIGTAGKTPFGLTEVAVGVRQYKDGMKVKTLGESFAFGIKHDSKQYNYIKDAIGKFRREG